MNRALLIWEEIPENTNLYYFKDLTDEEYNKLCMCQSHFVGVVNEGETEEEALALEWVSIWLEDKQDCLLSKDAPFNCKANTTVILSGFMMQLMSSKAQNTRVCSICKRPVATETHWRSAVGWEGYGGMTDELFEEYCFLPDEDLNQCYNYEAFGI